MITDPEINALVYEHFTKIIALDYETLDTPFTGYGIEVLPKLYLKKFVNLYCFFYKQRSVRTVDMFYVVTFFNSDEMELQEIQHDMLNFGVEFKITEVNQLQTILKSLS